MSVKDFNLAYSSSKEQVFAGASLTRLEKQSVCSETLLVKRKLLARWNSSFDQATE